MSTNDSLQRSPLRLLRRLATLVLSTFAASLMFLATAEPAGSVEEAVAASGPPFNIPVFVSSRTDACYDPGDVAAIKSMAADQQDLINRRGGVSGRPVQVIVHDDVRDQKKLIDNMRAALADPRTLAMVGLSGSTRAKPAFAALGNDIKASGIPFISDISDNNIFEPYPNVFTTRASLDDDSIPVIATFTRQLSFSRAAFVGLRDTAVMDVFSAGLKSQSGTAFVADIRLSHKDFKITPEEIATAITDLRKQQPDLIFLYVGAANLEEFLTQSIAAGLTPALFSGSPVDPASQAASKYQNAIYYLDWDSPPEVINNRLRRLISPANAHTWMFEGRKNAAAPGWTNGECKPQAEPEFPDPLNSKNLRAIVRGGQYTDMIALVAAAARTGARTTDLASLRARVLKALSNTYRTGHGSFKGAFENWSFVAGRRTAARDPFVVILPQQLGRTQLAPAQFVRTKDGSLRQMQTFYLDVDLIKAHRIDENEKTFFAEFYLSVRDNEGVALDKIDFANAYLDTQANGGRQISIEVIHPGGRSVAYPETMKIYKISGRFLFEPELGDYPFDTQRFSIDIQPKTGETPFIVQAPPPELRDNMVVTDGWDAKEQYVGYERDFVPVVDAYTLQPSAVPFYKASFVWVMQRHTTDYLLRVAIPLAFILFVAYFSVFIPPSHFEAIVTIQVTALLAAVALYLSLPKLGSDTATFSDRAFVFAYMVVSLMIGISILRVSPIATAFAGSERVLRLAHIFAVPILCVVAVLYVYGLSMAGR